MVARKTASIKVAFNKEFLLVSVRQWPLQSPLPTFLQATSVSAQTNP